MEDPSPIFPGVLHSRQRSLTALGRLYVFCILFLHCASPGMPVQGWLFTKTKIGISGERIQGSKEGKACVHNLFGIIAVGNASVGAAIRNGTLKRVNFLEREGESWIGIYAKTCTVAIGE